MGQPDFAYATARFMAHYGCPVDEELLFLLACPLFLAAHWPGPGQEDAPWFETENPCRFEYLASASGSPYQLRTIDGPQARGWVEGRTLRGEPLLLDLPEAILIDGAGELSGRRLCAYVSPAAEVELGFGSSRVRTMPVAELYPALWPRGDWNAVMFYAPLQPLPETYLREVVRQSLVKQHSLLSSCPYGPAQVGIESLRQSLRQDATDAAAVQRHRRLLSSLRSGRPGAGPAAGRRYYAHALGKAAPLCGTPLLEAAEAFGENASAWSDIAGRTARPGLSVQEIEDAYEAMWRAESALLQAMGPFAGDGVWS
jgi:hypothetical protein